MDLIVVMGPQAVGKMTVGKELEKITDSKLLFNHETIDLYAKFLGYTKETFRLSDLTRKELFRAFVEGDNNVTEEIIFTVVVAFDLAEDMAFLQEISALFTAKEGRVFFIELEANVAVRLERNVSESRLEAKPSKRNIAFSRHELLTSYERHRLNSHAGEVTNQFPNAHYLRIDNSQLDARHVADKIKDFIEMKVVEK